MKITAIAAIIVSTMAFLGEACDRSAGSACFELQKEICDGEQLTQCSAYLEQRLEQPGAIEPGEKKQDACARIMGDKALLADYEEGFEAYAEPQAVEGDGTIDDPSLNE